MPEINPADVAALKESVFGADRGNAPIASVGVNERSAVTYAPPAEPIKTPEEIAAAEPAAAANADNPFDTVKFLKDNFGYDSPELLKQEIEDYKKLKASPAQLAFKDDASKSYYEYLANGEEDKVLTALEARRMLKNVDTLNDEQKLKMYIKMTNPLYDQELIDDEYGSLYGVDEDKFKDDSGAVKDQIGLRKAKVRAEQQRLNDVQKANEHFAQYKSKIDLPKIQAPVDNDYADFQKFSEESNKKYDKLVQASKVLKPEDAPLSFKFNDEASKLNVDVSIQMDKEGFDKALQTVLSAGIIDESYFGQDGSPMVGRMVQDVYFNQNRDKVAADIIVQAVNAERKRYIASQKNYSEGGRAFVPQENSPVDDYKKAVFGK